MSEEELSSIRNIVRLHESKINIGNEKSSTEAGTSGTTERKSVKERLRKRVVADGENFGELHHHLNDQPCRFGWDRLNVHCMIRLATRLIIENDNFPRRCFIDPWAAWNAAGEETFHGPGEHKVMQCEAGLITFEWKNRGNSPYSYDRVADADVTLPSGKNFVHNFGIITNFCRTTVLSPDLILEHRVRPYSNHYIYLIPHAYQNKECAMIKHLACKWFNCKRIAEIKA